MNRENLEKLATYLEGLPKDYRDFDMADFFEGSTDLLDPDVKIHYARHNGGVGACGAVACAVGHGPSAGIYFNESQINDYGLNWIKYTEDNFCKVTGDSYLNTREFDWMFGGMWSNIDNTPHGAAARIRFLLDNNFVPTNVWNKDLYKEYLK